MSKFATVVFFTLIGASSGSHWEVGNGAVTTWKSVAVSGSGNHIFAAANDANAYVSADRGHTWSSVATPSPTVAFVTAAISNNGDYGYVASSATSNIYRTFDAGSTWESASSYEFNDVATTSDGRTVYGATPGTSSTVLKSVNHASTFTNVYTPNPSTATFAAIATSEDGQYTFVAASTPKYIYKSTDWGSSWTQTAQALTTGSGGYVDIACSKDGKYVYSAAPSAFIARSSDYGVTWHTVMTTSTETYTSVATSWSGRIVYTASNTASTGNVWQSTDFGSVWHQFNSGLTVGNGFATLGTSNSGDVTMVGDTTSSTGMYRRNEDGRKLEDSKALRA